MVKEHVKALVIGAGPAGLTAGSLLRSKGVSVTILERDAVVGGLSKTVDYKKCRFDIGPHHFITHVPEIEAEWKRLMGKDRLEHKRFTRLFYRKKFFYYPLRPINVITGLGLWECIACTASYIKAQLFPIKPVKTFHDFIVNRFGYRLFSHFFKTYTEKLWGIPCQMISADWAKQRIKSFSLLKAIIHAFFGKLLKQQGSHELFDAKTDIFYYPAYGAGTLWEHCAQELSHHEGEIIFNRNVIGIEHDGKRIKAIITRDHRYIMHGGVEHLQAHIADVFFSTMSLSSLVLALDPCAPEHVASAARKLVYRGLITVNLIIAKQDICLDHWLYIHDKDVRLVRVDNMNNFSPHLVNRPEHTALTLEYFSFTHENFWLQSDEALFEMAKHDIQKIGLAQSTSVLDGMVVRVPEAYPVYDQDYASNMRTVLDYLNSFENLFLMGRNGLHKYINMDAAMLSAYDAVKRMLRVAPVRLSKKERGVRLF